MVYKLVLSHGQPCFLYNTTYPKCTHHIPVTELTTMWIWRNMS